ncbi:MAG: AAA family ATPase [Microgenomates group bacterium]
MKNYEGNIGVVGLSGSGKSLLGQTLREELGWKAPVIDAGQFFRDALDKMGRQVQEGAKIPLRIDREVDSQTLDVLRGESQRIIVGRTVSHLAVVEGLGIERYVGIGVKCDGREIAGRAQKVWNRKKKLPEDTPLPSLRHILSVTKIRNFNDLGRYAKLYGIKSARDLYGKPPNIMIVHSDRMSLHEEVEAIMSQLRALNLLGNINK